MRLTAMAFAASVLALGGGLAASQETAAQLLDGTQIEYAYTDGRAVAMTFHDGKLRYRWIAGPFEGTEVGDLAYQSRKIGDELYLVSWHDTESPTFATMVINLEQNVLYSTALVRYGTDRQATLFQAAIIERVTRQ